jgi:hypothetical protein
MYDFPTYITSVLWVKNKIFPDYFSDFFRRNYFNIDLRSQYSKSGEKGNKVS